MKKNLFIHVGLHKTGTSSVQVEFTRARHILRRHGFLYPETGCPGWAPFGQHLLPWSLVDDVNLIPSNKLNDAEVADLRGEQMWLRLREEIELAGLSNVVVSSEEFDVLGATSIQKLQSFMPDFAFHPIIFLRNLSDFIEACYCTAVLHSGRTGDIREFAAQQRSRIDFYNLMLDWKQIAHEEKIVVASYDDPHIRRDVVISLLRILGLSADAIEPERLPFQNEGVSPIVVEFTRYLNGIGAPTADIDAFKSTMSSSSALRDTRRKFSNLPEDLRRELDSTYMRELDRIKLDAEMANMVLGQLILSPPRSTTLVADAHSALRLMVDGFIDK